MTLRSKEKWGCECGKLIDIDWYESVNIDLDPDLADKLRDRKINSFECANCGFKVELFAGFLYHDMQNNFRILVLPKEDLEGKPEAIRNRTLEDRLYKLLRTRRLTVYGYDEFLRSLEMLGGTTT